MMLGHEKEVGFSFDAQYGDRTKYFNIDGSMARHVNVWVEALDDQRFWMGYLTANDYFKFAFKQPTDIDSLKSTTAGGCDRLFYYEKNEIIKLGVTEIFCLDSDDSYVKGLIGDYMSPKKVRPFVYSTNIYAIENAFLSGDLIDRTFEAVVARPVAALTVTPSVLVRELSKTIFPLLKRMAFYEVSSKDCEDAIRIRRSLRAYFRSLRNVNCNDDLSRCEVLKRFVTSVDTLHVEICTVFKELKLEDAYEKFEVEVHEAGINPENAFLFYRGHSIFDSVIKAFARLSDSYRLLEVAKVEAAFKNSGAQAVNDQVVGVNKAWVALGETLKQNFYVARPSVPFLNDACARLKADYNQR
jgi:hypothetical protein